MVRRKEYDRGDVLERAAELFWQQGYKASSMSDLVKATGLNSASMYKEFGDKDGLFEECLAWYHQEKLSPRLKMLLDEPNLQGVEALLDSVVQGSVAETYKGCLMMNHLAQKHSISPYSAQLIGEFCVELEDLLETALQNAKASCDIPADKDPAALASFIMCYIHGLVLYGRHPNKKGSIPKLHDIVFAALSA